MAVYCKSTFFAAVYFRVFVFMGIFAVIYFHGLQYWTMQEQCTICLFGHFQGDFFSRNAFSRENKSIAKIN